MLYSCFSFFAKIFLKQKYLFFWLNTCEYNFKKTELYAVRRMACHDRHSRQRGGSKIQFTQTDETVLKLMGLFDSIPTYDIVSICVTKNAF